MKSNVFFVLKESVDGLRRSMFHSFIAVAASMLAVLALGMIAYGAVNLQRAAQGLLGTLQFEAFVSLSVPEELHPELEKLIQELDPRWKVTYVSSREAARAFAREFDPELFNILKENPLPASFRISLPPEEMSPDSARRAAELLLAIEGIDDVIYDREIIDLLHAATRKLTGWGLTVGALAVLLAVGLTFNAVRLKIMAERETMNLMLLLGAVPGTLRAIYWVQGAILGAIGGLLSAGLILLLAGFIQFRLINGVDIAVPHPYLMVVGGCLLGMVAGGLAVGKYLKV